MGKDGVTLNSISGDITREKVDELRDSEVVSVLTLPLKEVSNIDEDPFNSAVIAAFLAQSPGEEVSWEDIGTVIQWASNIQSQCTMLLFFLIGATEIKVENGQVNHRMTGGTPDEMMRQLVRNGIAKPKTNE